MCPRSNSPRPFDISSIDYIDCIDADLSQNTSYIKLDYNEITYKLKIGMVIVMDKESYKNRTFVAALPLFHQNLLFCLTQGCEANDSFFIFQSCMCQLGIKIASF